MFSDVVVLAVWQDSFDGWDHSAVLLTCQWQVDAPFGVWSTATVLAVPSFKLSTKLIGGRAKIWNALPGMQCRLSAIP